MHRFRTDYTPEQLEMFEVPGDVEAKIREGYRYEPETGEIYSRRSEWRGPLKGWQQNRGYVLLDVCGGHYLRSRLAFLLMHGRWPIAVDHVNRDRIDDRWSNLREVTPRENMRNRSDSGVSYLYRGKYRAQAKLPVGVFHTPVQCHVGRYDFSEEAERANAQVQRVADAIDRYILRPFYFESFRDLLAVADMSLTQFIDQADQAIARAPTALALGRRSRRKGA